MPTITKVRRYRRSSAGNFNHVVHDSAIPDFSAFHFTTYLSDTSSVTKDGPVPGYRDKIARGLEATSFLSGTIRETKLTEGLYALGRRTSYTSKDWYWNYSSGNFVTTSPYVGTLFLSNTAVNQAKAQFIRKCIEAQTAFQGGTFIGELAETLRMIRRPGQALRSGIDDYFKALKRRRKGPLKHRRRVLAETWLEYSFGWTPLINDISGASEALSRILYSRRPFQMVRGYGHDATDVPKPTLTGGPGVMSFYYRVPERVDSFVKYYGVVNLDVSNGYVMSASNLGFRWDQFVPTVWELVPYSFLVDYFTNIGDIISSWSFASSRLRWSSRGSKVTNSREAVISAPFINNGTHPIDETWVIKPCSARAESSTVLRTPLAGSLVPTLEFEIPGSKSLKWLNLAALARSRRSLTPY